ncbi:MAG TPA: nucleotidyl transferase AbiEii/AbiGii toxin family protein [Actinospica sp.]|nr:nucleotidyl transferase AbiEii/AbiGii toxin family protein [Actinospica sp.]
MSRDEIWTRLGEVRGGAAKQTLPKGWQLRFPNTLRTVYEDGQDQQPVFEPALLHFPNAYRAGDPRFPDPELAHRWLAARRKALGLVLAAVSASGYADDLMLRGSVLMSSWYPEAAREPGDLDFVVLADTWKMPDPRTFALFEALARTAEQLSAEDDTVRVDASGAVGDEIWTYDRVPGRRLMLPWHTVHADLPGGWIQLDFVFGEKIHLEPERAEIAGAQLLVASKELSLAWKLVWLLTDMHPQGKDLYDAVLLAQDVPLRYSVARDAICEADPYYAARPLVFAELTELDVEAGWDHFQREYPAVEGSADDWKLKLCTALEPTFTRLDGRAASPYELEAAWLAPLIAQIAAETDDRGGRLQQVLVDRHLKLSTAIVVTRELVGRDEMTAADAVRTVLSVPARAAAGQQSDRYWPMERAARAYGVELRAPWPKHLADAPVVAVVRAEFHDFMVSDALEILAPLATDPDPRFADGAVLAEVVRASKGDLTLLHCAVQRARTAALNET